MYDTTFEGYMMFRLTEAEHIARYKRQSLYPDWVEQSANPEYERHLYDSDPYRKASNGNR